MDQELTDPRAVSALRSLAHPVRLRILSLLTAEAMSAAEVARVLGLTHANASYHLRVLHDAGELVEAGEERIRGGVAKRYRYVVPEAPDGPPATRAELIGYAGAIGREVTRRLADRRRGPGQLGDLETWVEPEVWADAVRRLSETMELLHAAARPAGTPGTVHVSASTIAFPMTTEQRGPAR